MKMLVAAVMVMLSLPAVADVVDGVIYLVDPGKGFYVIDTNTDLYSFCFIHASQGCLGPWSLPLHIPRAPVHLVADPPLEPPEAEPESDY